MFKALPLFIEVIGVITDPSHSFGPNLFWPSLTALIKYDSVQCQIYIIESIICDLQFGAAIADR